MTTTILDQYITETVYVSETMYVTDKMNVTDKMHVTDTMNETLDEITEDEFVANLPTALIISVYAPIMIMTVSGNSLVLAVAYRHKAMRLTTSILIGSLAVADMLIGGFVVPTSLISAIMGTNNKGTVMCKVMPYTQLTSVTASISSMVLIAIERYHVIMRLHLQPFSVKRTITMVSMSWCLSACYGLRVFVPTGEDEGESTEVCDALNEDEDADIYLRVTDLVVLVMVPLVIMTILYGKIISHIWRSRSVSNQQSFGKKAGAIKVRLRDIQI